MATPTYSEDELGQKWDRCLTDGVLKTGGGLAIGILASLLFFKRRSWPILVGTGFGFGLAFGNCERDINATFALPSSGSSKKA